MTRAAIFWALMLIWLIFGMWIGWPQGGGDFRTFAPLGNQLLAFLLFGLLGWQAFGPAVKG